jgi:fructoselysine-6-phosphate deglycase
MLNFDEDRFLTIQSGATALVPQIVEAVSDAISKGAENLFFLGTGGVAYLMEPAIQWLRRDSGFPVFADYPAQVMAMGNRNLTNRSLVILPSLSGTTTESVALLAHVQQIGARVITLVGNAESPLGRGGQPAMINPAADDTSSESFQIQALAIALAVMQARGELSDHEEIEAGLQRLPQALLATKRAFEPHAARLAQTIAADSYHMFTAAGPMWPAANYYATCILEEMQWIRTRPVHAADFFHGPLELIEPGVSLILMRGEDAAAPLADRVAAFAPRYTDRFTVIDTAPHVPADVSPRLRALLSPTFMATMLERVSAHLEVIRNHPLTTRRYYKRVAY